MSFTVEANWIFQGVTTAVVMLIGYFIKGIYRDFKKHIEKLDKSIITIQMSIVELKTLQTVTDKEIAKMNTNFVAVDGLKNDMAVMKRDMETAWRRIEQVSPRNNQ